MSTSCIPGTKLLLGRTKLPEPCLLEVTLIGQKAKQTKIQCDNPLGGDGVLGAVDVPTVSQEVTGQASQATGPSAIANRKGRLLYLLLIC